MRKKYLPKPDETPGREPVRRVIGSPALDPSLSRSPDTFEGIQLKEPELLFAAGQRCVDPKTGLGAYGAHYRGSGATERKLRLGIVGTSEGIERVLELLDEISRPVEHDPGLDAIAYPSFPGLHAGHPFYVNIDAHASLQRPVTPEALKIAEGQRDPSAARETARELFGEPVRAMSRLANPPPVVLCALPESIESRFLKPACAEFLPTEIIRDGRLPDDQVRPKDRATAAWDFSARLLRKAGLDPWRIADAQPGECFVGISFRRARDGKAPQPGKLFAHVVNETGDGFILDGGTPALGQGRESRPAPWLDTMNAARLMSRILDAYEKAFHRLPVKVAVHKTSAYTRGEREGFEVSLRQVKRFGLISVSRRGTLLLRPGREMISRGAAIAFDEKLGLVHTAGYIPFLRCAPRPDLPLPLEITENWGGLPFQEAANDILRLTKMDWSSCDFSSEEPFTLAAMAGAREILDAVGSQDFALNDRFSL